MQESPKKDLQFYTNVSIAKMDTHHAKGITSRKKAEMTNNLLVGEHVHKRTRIPKKHILDGEHDEDDDGEEALVKYQGPPRNMVQLVSVSKMRTEMKHLSDVV